MAITVNTNVASLNAQKNLTGSQSMLNRALERLSSGLRVNSAKDDAAGLAIADRMNAQIRGLNQSVRNANDGISMAQTAEGAMNEVTNNLQRIRELAVQSANASNTATDRASINDEVTQLVAEIDRVSTTTSFNGNKILSGTFSSQAFQVGTNKGESISFSIASMRSSSLGVGSSSSYSASLGGTETTSTALTAGMLTINGYEVGAAAADGVSLSSAVTATNETLSSSASAIAVANAINAISGDTGVSATVNDTTVAGTAATAFATAIDDGDVRINGVSIGAVAAGSTAIDRGNDVAAAINSISDQTGVTATFSTSNGAVSLTAADGRNITIEYAGDSTTQDTVTGLTAVSATKATATSDTTRSTVDIATSGSAGIVIGGSAEANAGLATGLVAATATAGAGVSSIDVSTVSGAEDALAIVDAALERVDTERGNLGAIQNRMESTIANLMNVSQNISAARGRIVDADFAAETANMTKSQILQQAGMAMLSQANSIPQGALTLLQG